MQEFLGLSVKLVRDTTGLQCGKILETIVDRALRAYKKKEPLVPVKIQASRPRSVVAFDLAVLPWSSQVTDTHWWQ